eukprot:3928562-Alexandrium_andersonii.AAC.1
MRACLRGVALRCVCAHVCVRLHARTSGRLHACVCGSAGARACARTSSSSWFQAQGTRLLGTSKTRFWSALSGMSARPTSSAPGFRIVRARVATIAL